MPLSVSHQPLMVPSTQPPRSQLRAVAISRSARDEKPVTECPLVIVGLLDRIRYAEQRIALHRSCSEASWRGLRTE